jgi:hypothetical protein
MRAKTTVSNFVSVYSSLRGHMNRQNCIFCWTKNRVALGLMTVSLIVTIWKLDIIHEDDV